MATVVTSGHLALCRGISAPARRSRSCAAEVVGSLLLQPGAFSLLRLLRGARLSGVDGLLEPLVYVHIYKPCLRLHTSSAMPALPPPAAKATRPLYHANRRPACSSSACPTIARSTSPAARTSPANTSPTFACCLKCLSRRSPLNAPRHASSISPPATIAIVLY